MPAPDSRKGKVTIIETTEPGYFPSSGGAGSEGKIVPAPDDVESVRSYRARRGAGGTRKGE